MACIFIKTKTHDGGSSGINFNVKYSGVTRVNYCFQQADQPGRAAPRLRDNFGIRC